MAEYQDFYRVVQEGIQDPDKLFPGWEKMDLKDPRIEGIGLPGPQALKNAVYVMNPASQLMIAEVATQTFSGADHPGPTSSIKVVRDRLKKSLLPEIATITSTKRNKPTIDIATATNYRNSVGQALNSRAQLVAKHDLKTGKLKRLQTSPYTISKDRKTDEALQDRPLFHSEDIFFSGEEDTATLVTQVSRDIGTRLTVPMHFTPDQTRELIEKVTQELMRD